MSSVNSTPTSYPSATDPTAVDNAGYLGHRDRSGMLGLMENMVERKVSEIEALHANVSHLEIPQPLPTNFPLAETMAELDTTEQRLRRFLESDAEITETITTQLAAVLERGRPLIKEMQNELERTRALRDLVQRSEAIELVVPADDPFQPKVTVGRMSSDGLLSTFAWDIARLEAGIATKERAMEQSAFGFRVSLEGQNRMRELFEDIASKVKEHRERLGAC